MKARDNPFRAARVLSAIRYADPHPYALENARRGPRDPAGHPDAHRHGAVSLLPRLEALGYRAAIAGPHGSGKTTLLEDLERVLAERGFRITHVRLDGDNRRQPRHWPWSARRLDAADIVCLDGADELGPIAWMWLRWQVRRAGGLIITTHRRGRLATLVVCATSAALLDRIIRRLAPDGLPPHRAQTARRGPGLAAAPTAAELFARHRGNLRDALRELYDVYAATPDM